MCIVIVELCYVCIIVSIVIVIVIVIVTVILSIHAGSVAPSAPVADWLPHSSKKG